MKHTNQKLFVNKVQDEAGLTYDVSTSPEFSDNEYIVARGVDNEADARLIAAAPEMLAALEALSKAIARQEETMPYQNRIDIIGELRDARQAIAKAKGGV